MTMRPWAASTTFDRTYEGLKLPQDIRIVDYVAPTFDRTYEGLKPAPRCGGSATPSSLLTVPMRV